MVPVSSVEEEASSERSRADILWNLEVYSIQSDSPTLTTVRFVMWRDSEYCAEAKFFLDHFFEQRERLSSQWHGFRLLLSRSPHH